MSKTVVIFQSKYGSTKQYAEWISQELSCELFERSKIKAEDLKPFDTIIYGGGLYAGGVSGINLITKHYDKLCDKNLILFTCGLADPTEKSNTDQIKKGLCKVLTDEMQKNIKIFHLRGGIDYQKLGMIHKGMMAMLRKMILKKESDSMSDEDKEMLNTYGQVVDFKDRGTIVPIVNYVRGL